MIKSHPPPLYPLLSIVLKFLTRAWCVSRSTCAWVHYRIEITINIHGEHFTLTGFLCQAGQTVLFCTELPVELFWEYWSTIYRTKGRILVTRINNGFDVTLYVNPLNTKSFNWNVRLLNPFKAEFTNEISFTTCRELLSKFSTCSEWTRLAVSDNSKEMS